MFSAIKKAFGLNQDDVGDLAQEDLPIATGAVNHKLHSTPKVHEKFPQVRSLAINLMISPPDYETEPTLNGRSFGPDSLAYFEFRCKNVECVDGGFDITETLTEAIGKGERSLTGRRVCHGSHGRQSNTHNEIKCRYELNFRININYIEN